MEDVLSNPDLLEIIVGRLPGKDRAVAAGTSRGFAAAWRAVTAPPRVGADGALIEPARCSQSVRPGQDLQAALDACPYGGSLRLLPGLHEIPCMLVARGAVAIFGPHDEKHEGATITGAYCEHALLSVVGGGRVVMQDVTVRGGAWGASACDSEFFGDDGRCSDRPILTLRRCAFELQYQGAVHASTGSRLAVLGCTINGRRQGVVERPSRWFVGIEVNNADSAVVEGNEVAHCYLGVSAFNSRVAVTDNRVKDCEDGITLLGCKHSAVKGNSIENVTDSGVEVRESFACAVTHNKVRGCRMYSISIISNSHSAIVSDNVLEAGSLAAIRVRGARGVTVERNAIAGGHNIGLLIAGSFDAHVADNSFEDLAFHAVEVDNSAGVCLDRNRVSSRPTVRHWLLCNEAVDVLVDGAKFPRCSRLVI